MTVALAEKPRSIETPPGFDPRLRIPASDVVRQGASNGHDQPDRLSALVNAPVSLGVRRPTEFRAQIATGEPDDARSLHVFADLAKREANGQQAVVLRCRAGALT